MDIQANGAPPLNQVITQMLGHLEGEVQPNRARLASVRERPVGLANWRGVDVFGSMVPVALKGGRLDAGVFFEITRNLPDDADTAALELHGNLLAARDGLRAVGFLRIDGPDFSLPVQDPTTQDWRKTVSYRVLYEYQYRDVDGSRRFITRIPVHADPEEEGSPDRQSFVVTGRVIRWQREDALREIPPPPALVLRGPASVSGFTVAAFLPDSPGAAVEVLRTFDGAAGAPAVAATLQDLVAAEHIRMSFPSLGDLLAVLTAPADTVELADLNGNPASYGLRTFAFSPGLHLPRTKDRLEITTAAGAWGGSNAVLYLRAEGA